MSDFKVGDLVTVKGEEASGSVLGVIFKVTKINPKTVVAYPVVKTATVNGKGIRYPGEILEKFEGEVPESGRLSAVTVPILEFFDVGQIVTFKRPPAGDSPETPFVVTKDGGDKINLSKLGGADGPRYYRVTKSSVVKRDLPWLGETLNPSPPAG